MLYEKPWMFGFAF